MVRLFRWIGGLSLTTGVVTLLAFLILAVGNSRSAGPTLEVAMALLPGGLIALVVARVLEDLRTIRNVLVAPERR